MGDRANGTAAFAPCDFAPFTGQGQADWLNVYLFPSICAFLFGPKILFPFPLSHSFVPVFIPRFSIHCAPGNTFCLADLPLRRKIFLDMKKVE
jgi:hypothetical protein